MTLQMAFGKDAKTMKEVRKMWEDNCDFIVADVMHGPGLYVSRRQLENDPHFHEESVGIRYKRNTEICFVPVKKNK